MGLVKESEKEIYKEPFKHSVRAINKDDLRFSSTFDISKLKLYMGSSILIGSLIGGYTSNLFSENSM